jgi:nucleotide-binding universal stress UspA family protein
MIMKIIAAIDFSDITPRLLEQTSILAKALGAELFLIHVAEPNPDHIAYDYDPATVYTIDSAEVRSSIAERFQQEHKTLQEYAENMREQGISCTAMMIQGIAVDLLLKEAERLEAAFIIAGTHGKGLISQLLLGSISEQLIKQTTIPVHLVPAQKD